MTVTSKATSFAEPIVWENGRLRILDQTLLPNEMRYIALDRLDQVWEAIKMLRVRGAPAIGCCAAFGVVVGLREKLPRTAKEAADAVECAAAHLATSRPTAVNLFWALDRVRRVASALPVDISLAQFQERIEAEAVAIFEENRRICEAIADVAAGLIEDGYGVLTHCNAGPLATAGYGTALAGILRAHELGRRVHVYADETRPLLQGARLTAWELTRAGIEVTLICDNTAAQVMREGRVQLVIVGADRIAANGDTANKVGTYGVAVLARAHGIPFYVAAPSTTFDLSIPAGDRIPIEQRDAAEITRGFGRPTAPEGINIYNPAFDVTPATMITGFITERGLLRPPYEGSIRTLSG